MTASTPTPTPTHVTLPLPLWNDVLRAASAAQDSVAQQPARTPQRVRALSEALLAAGAAATLTAP